MSDPFSILRLYDEFDAASISTAFAAAVQRGVSVAEARAAMDLVRDPASRAAASLVAPSMCAAAVAERARPQATHGDATTPSDTLLRFLAAILGTLDIQLASSAITPAARGDVDEFLPPLPAALEP